MMVIHGIFEEWNARLLALRALIETEPAGPVWLWRIQIRILEYLVARYAGRGLLVAPRTAPARSTRPLAWPAVPHPPRDIGSLAPLLLDLVQINDERRAGEPAPPDLEEAWNWWRSLMSG